MKGHLKKLPGGALVPDDEATLAFIQKIKVGDVISAEIKKPRNYMFHKKYFSLLNFCYEYWEPATTEYKGLSIEKNFERFREDVTIAAGWYEVVPMLNGEAKAIAKSISFSNMSEDDFGTLYNDVINVLLKYVMHSNGFDKDELNQAVNGIMEYA